MNLFIGLPREPFTCYWVIIGFGIEDFVKKFVFVLCWTFDLFETIVELFENIDLVRYSKKFMQFDNNLF